MRKINKWDYQYLELANYLGKMSNCAAKQIGCLIVKNGDTIISSGINGTPKGYTNCNEIFFKKNDEWYSKLASDKNDYVVNEGVKYYKIKNTDMTHKEFTLNHEVHAEINAISKMARVVGLVLDDGLLVGFYYECSLHDISLDDNGDFVLDTEFFPVVGDVITINEKEFQLADIDEGVVTLVRGDEIRYYSFCDIKHDIINGYWISNMCEQVCSPSVKRTKSKVRSPLRPIDGCIYR